MTIAQLTEKEYLYQLIEKYSNDLYCLELIQFFGWHPNTGFSSLAILHALSGSDEHRYVENALNQLVDKGLVKTYSENDTAYYRLVNDRKIRQAALNITRLDWNQWQGLLMQHS